MSYPVKYIVTIFLIFNLQQFQTIGAVSVEDDLTLSNSEGKKLDEFKARMSPRLKDAYMKEDLYLVRWLRARNFNVDEAERMLMNNLQWREENRIDEIDKEDWSYFEEEFAYYIDARDNEGRPVLTVESTRWDVREAVISGQREKLIRWMLKMLEDVTKEVRVLETKGENVTRWSMIFNLGYFNLVQSGCLQCLPVYASFVTSFENYYPNTMDRLTLVNSPAIFEVVLTVIRPLMSPSSRQSLRAFGTNKAQWREVLLNEIPRDQLTKEYGGTKETHNFE